jgi:hypothetical protein
VGVTLWLLRNNELFAKAAGSARCCQIQVLLLNVVLCFELHCYAVFAHAHEMGAYRAVHNSLSA